MITREKVRKLLSHQKIDEPIADLGGRVSSFCTPAYLQFKQYLGFGGNLVDEKTTLLNTVGELDERVLNALNIPFRRLYLKPAARFRLEIARDGTFKDEWGVTYKPAGHYNERIGHPLATATIQDLGAFPWLNPEDAGRTAGLAVAAARMARETGFCLVAGHVSAGIFQDCWNLRGMERFFFDLVENKAFAEALLERVTEIHIRLWQVFLDAVGEYVDIVETADDLGSQQGLLISPKMYREVIKPRHAALNAAIRQKTRARILYHSCGAILPLIPDLIEAGVEILNPIQPIAGLLEPEALKLRFENRLIFHGGLDVQRLLLSGAPEEVRQHVRRYVSVLGAGNYIMAPSNSIQPGTPPENIAAAYDEIQKIA
jgi:uroporphyrinogen decarboxylase